MMDIKLNNKEKKGNLGYKLKKQYKTFNNKLKNILKNMKTRE